MNADAIWWEQIGSSLTMLRNLSDCLRDGKSVVLQLFQPIPWRERFYNSVDMQRSMYGGQKRIRRLEWMEGADPGEEILSTFCSKNVQAEYWPGQSYAQYLGSREDITLSEYIVWITGISTKPDIIDLTQFVMQYEQAASHQEQRAIFVLEYEGEGLESCPIEKITYKVENHDCRVFAIEMAEALKNTPQRSYQAELALHISAGVPEFCCSLLETGEQLLRAPVETALELIGMKGDSEADIKERIEGAVWEASIIQFFPILERFRKELITVLKNDLKYYLPFSNNYGETIRDPFDLEVGDLYHIVNKAMGKFSQPLTEAVYLCRRVRNLLAHNHNVPYEDACKIMDEKGVFADALQQPFRSALLQPYKEKCV